MLAKVPLFSSLKPAYLSVLAERLATRKYGRGTIIFHKDDPGATLYVVKSGRVKIVTSSADGDDVILAILSDGDFFGELSVLDGKPRSASAVAMETTITLTLSRRDILDVISGEPELAIAMLATMSERLRCTNLLVEDVFFLSVPARLTKRLLDLAKRHGIQTGTGLKIDMRLTQGDLANSIGASRESVNRLLGLFQDEGLISIDKQHIIILRSDDLSKHMY